ncbi:MAG: hypothetical protein NT144_01605 [Bacteroidia bacterium]|nr:hypothetical protein [Bacteroidia bacterium]
MRIAIKLFLFLILAMCFSCEEQGLFVNCPDCTADEPVRAELEAKLETNYYSDVIIQIWEGNLEDSILLGTYISNATTFSHEVTINKKYTVTATYSISGINYIAVDSAIPRVKYDKEQCDDPCFFVYDRICDLRLKYTK